MELFTTYSKKVFPLYLSSLVIDKITEWCRNFPNNEWSGVIFYTTEGSMQDNTFKIHCKDIYVQNIGSATYTEYDENADSVNYADEHNLLDCYTGTIHSHNTMAAFFSGTDDNTLKERSKDMPHFLSVIVNNKLDCVAKITKILKFDKASISYDTFNGDKVSIDNHSFNNFSVINITNLEVIKEGYNEDIHNEVLERIKELKEEERAKTLSIPKTNNSYLNTTYIGTPYYQPKYNQPYNLTTSKGFENVKEPELFNNPYPAYADSKTGLSTISSSSLDEVTDDSIEEFESYIELIYNKLLTGDILANETSLTPSFVNNMEKYYNNAFRGSQKDLQYWIDTYVDYLVCCNNTIDSSMVANALIEKLEVEDVDNSITRIMLKTLEEYI